jgi:hypothetical protein
MFQDGKNTTNQLAFCLAPKKSVYQRAGTLAQLRVWQA